MENNESENSKPPIGKSYARYTGIGIQMILFVLAGVFIGLKLDAWLKLAFPVFTLSLIMISLGLSMYFAIKELNRKD
jgi:hypothetical protein